MTHPMLMFVPVLALLSSCSREAPPAPPTLTAPPAPSGPSASDALDQMDKRAPVPLLPMMANHQKQEMRDHLVAVQEIVTALAMDDYPAIEKAASRISSAAHQMGEHMGHMGHMGQMGQMGQMGEHMGQMGQTCTAMGAGAAGFTAQALAFHRTADGIVTAARNRDRTQVLTELGTTMQACTSCHAKWKQQVVDEPTWERLNAGDSGAPPKQGAHGVQH